MARRKVRSGKVLLVGGGSSQAIAALRFTDLNDTPAVLGTQGQGLRMNAAADALEFYDIENGLSYQGTWDASTNTPAIADGVGVGGQYYIVGTAGTTSVDGVADWQPGDWIIFQDETNTWQKIDQSETEDNIVDTIANLPNPTTILTGTKYQVVTDTVANNGMYQVTGAVGANGTSLEKI